MKLKIGKILKAQGIKGEIKLACYLDDVSMISGLKNFYIGLQDYVVEHIRTDGNFCYAKLKGVLDRNSAEKLKDMEVFADKECISLPKNRFFIDDLLGCEVHLNNGEKIGTVTDVLQYGAADVFVCKREGKTVSFPFLNDLVVFVDIESKIITLENKRFAEVAVYED